MKILIGCECSGIVRDAFRARGHDAYSCDIKPAETGSRWHVQGNIRDVACNPIWDMLIAHPPCTYLCVSGLHWNKRRPGREQKTVEAIRFAEFLWGLDIPRIAIENPVGCLSTRSKLGRPSQYIQPYEFGEDASKKTGLWLKGLLLLRGTERVPGRFVNGKERWSNQTDSGQNRLGPSAQRATERSRTYPGIARAMAEQWG